MDDLAYIYVIRSPLAINDPMHPWEEKDTG